MVAIFDLFSSNYDLVTLITSKLLIRYTQYSIHCMLVLIPRLHQFFRKFGKISGSWPPSSIFFVKLEPCHPDIYKTAFSIHFVFNYLMQVLIPRLHQFFRKFEKIFGSSRPSLIRGGIKRWGQANPQDWQVKETVIPRNGLCPRIA